MMGVVDPMAGVVSKRKINPMEGVDPMWGVAPVEGVYLYHEG